MELTNSRFIHTKMWMPRLTETLVIDKMKNKIFDKTTKFQIGGQPGMRTQFHLFVVKSVMAVRENRDEGAILTLIDIQKFFDKQNLVDAMDSLFESGVNEKCYRIWYKLNQNTKISVRTGAGCTEIGYAGGVTGQGGSGAALASALNLDSGVNSYFAGSKDEDCYGGIRLQPLSYIDDLLRCTNNVSCTRAGNIKLSMFLEEKQLEAHPKKTCYILIGSKKLKKNVRKEIEVNPFVLGKVAIKEKVCDKYLGDILSSGGVADSIDATVDEREGRVKGAIRELAALCEDFRMQITGGMMGALDLYESCIIPSLMANSGTWFGIREKMVERLEKIQNTFVRSLLRLPMSTPKPCLRAVCGLLGMKWRIWLEKINLVNNIRRAEDGTLAKQVLEVQIRFGWPGLASEVANLCQVLALPNVGVTEVDKKVIKDAIRMHHLRELKKELSKYKKVENMANMDLRKPQDYLSNRSLHYCRTACRLQTQMFDCRANMPGKYGGLTECMNCVWGQVESQQHLEICPAFANLRVGKDLELNADDRVKYFMELENIRNLV